MRFVAIDVETANPDLSSICQIGIVSFDDGSVTSTWQQFVNPEDYFDPWNVSIHGIKEDTVDDAPILPELYPELQELLDNQIVVCHSSFDRLSLGRATEKYGLPRIACTWMDSTKIVRRAWPGFASSGYGLANITKALGIVFQHHLAQEDARAAGEVVLRAIAATGINLDDWLIRVRQPISSHVISQLVIESNPEGPLSGEIVAFTGTLSIPRREMAKLAATVGCTVSKSVNKSTTILVVGDQDIRKFAGQEKSLKHRTAEDLISRGHPIRILGESDFCLLIRHEVPI